MIGRCKPLTDKEPSSVLLHSLVPLSFRAEVQLAIVCFGSPSSIWGMLKLAFHSFGSSLSVWEGHWNGGASQPCFLTLFSAVRAPGLLCLRWRHTTVMYPVTCGIHSRWTAAGSAIIVYTFLVGHLIFFLAVCVYVTFCFLTCWSMHFFLSVRVWLQVQYSLFDPCCGNKSLSIVIISVDFQRVKCLLCIIDVFICEKTLHRSKRACQWKANCRQLLQDSTCKLFSPVHHKNLGKNKGNVSVNIFYEKWSPSYSLTLSVAIQ